MNVPSLPTSIIASLAGTDRAAAQRNVSATTAENTPHTIVDGESIDGLKEGSQTGDSEADGRQMLDTFERRNSPEDDPEKVAPKPSAHPDIPVNRTSRLDLQA